MRGGKEFRKPKHREPPTNKSPRYQASRWSANGLFQSAIALLFVLLLCTSAEADKRVALIIGNSAYKHTSELANPRNDATDVAAALTTHGFQVITGFDLDKSALDRKIRDFAVALQGADVGLFFYAGHGLQVSGQNYIVPVDAELATASALDFEMVSLSLVHRIMEREAQTNILFLDACRNNPLARNLARAMGTRSTEIGRGLAAVESGVGTLISFSTQPGNVALDGTGRNSPFAGALVRHISSANSDLSTMLINVRNDVMRETLRKQVPWEHSALTGQFYFKAQAVSKPLASISPPLQSSDAEHAWILAKDTKSITVLESFIARYKDTFYAELARERILELNARAKAAAEADLQAKRKADEERRRAEAAARPDPALAVKPGSGQSFRDRLANGQPCPTCPEMVVVPAGDVMMGSPEKERGRSDVEGPQHRVTIANPFAVGKFSITRGEFAVFVREMDYKTEGGCVVRIGSEWQHQPDLSWRFPSFDQNDQHPVVCVNWHDAKAFTAWLSKKVGKAYRLLTEAEREYSTRANTATRYSFGDDAAALSEYAWYQANAGGGTHPVGEKRPNAFGLFDMHGNAWAWCEDTWHPRYHGAPNDGSAWLSDGTPSRVWRGGSWIRDPNGLRSAFRIRSSPDDRYYDVGFRVARGL